MSLPLAGCKTSILKILRNKAWKAHLKRAKKAKSRALVCIRLEILSISQYVIQVCSCPFRVFQKLNILRNRHSRSHNRCTQGLILNLGKLLIPKSKEAFLVHFVRKHFLPNSSSESTYAPTPAKSPTSVVFAKSHSPKKATNTLMKKSIITTNFIMLYNKKN